MRGVRWGCHDQNTAERRAGMGGVSYMEKQISRFLGYGLNVELYFLLSLMQIRKKSFCSCTVGSAHVKFDV